MSMYSVILEPTKSILVGTRTTYQATEDASSVFFALIGRTIAVGKLVVY